VLPYPAFEVESRAVVPSVAVLPCQGQKEAVQEIPPETVSALSPVFDFFGLSGLADFSDLSDLFDYYLYSNDIVLSYNIHTLFYEY
jgi:hypothetical protein